MAKERRDSKNRILGKGEYQKADGRYMYRYIDSNGNAGYVYSWTLTKSDRAPKGKTPGKCLRDLEREIAIDIQDGIDVSASRTMTLNDYFEKHMALKQRLKPTSRQNYNTLYNSLVRDTLGNRKISDIKYTSIKSFYNSLILERGLAVASVGALNIVLNPVFKLAVRDGCIRTNPVSGVLAEIKKESAERPQKKRALTISQQISFMTYVYKHNVYSKWYSLFVFLLGTGCRIGEACGVTWSDCDFSKNTITISRSACVVFDEVAGKHVSKITTPKTAAGTREIPMLSEVRKVLLQERARQLKLGIRSTELDGVHGFVFFNKNGNIHHARNINKVFTKVVKLYNRDEQETAKLENRTPNLLPEITPHILRHTFCTRMCEEGINIKVVQEVMGHTCMSVTMDIYNDVTNEFKAKELEGFEVAMSIG